MGDPSAAARALDTQANFSMHKDKFEKLRSDVTIKLKFLDENKVEEGFRRPVSLDKCIYAGHRLDFLWRVFNLNCFLRQIKVMHKQLLLFHNAISAYFSGNQSALDATLKQFNIKLKVKELN